MGLTVEWVGYGRPAAEALRRRIAWAKAGDPLAPVTVVVPSNHVGVGARRLLASGSLGPVCGRGVGLAAVTFLTVYRLAEMLGSPALATSGRRPVSTPILAAALRGALSEEPGLFGPVAAHPATEAALVASYRELRDVPDDGLEELAGASRRAGDVVRLHRAARRRLEARWYDEEDLMEAATAALAPAGDDGAHSAARLTDELGGLVVHLPQRLSLHAARLLAAWGRRSEVVVVAGTTGEARADEDVVVALGRLGVPSPSPSSAGPGLAAVIGAERTCLASASDADDEVRAAVRAVVERVRAGVPLDRIAILHAAADPYARLVHEHLAAAGLAVNGAAVAPVAASMAGRTLLQLLALRDTGFRRQDVLAWLASAPVLVTGSWAPTNAWERLSRRAAVVAGRRDWDRRLATLADELDSQAARPRPDSPAWVAERDRADAERARQLRHFVLGLIDDLDRAGAGPLPWDERARWAARLVHETLGGETRRLGWPLAERRAAERVALALDRLAALAAVEGPVTLEVFARTLALELEDDLGRVGRFGEGVLVGPVGLGVGLDLDLVVVLGLAEGSFPAAVGDDSLLPDRERETAGGDLGLRRHQIDRQHRHLLAALAGASHQLLGIPRGDLRRSRERPVSRWALAIASTLAGRALAPGDLEAMVEPWLDHLGSFTAGLRHMSTPATAQEHRLASLLACGSDPPEGPQDPVLARGMEVVTARRSAAFTRFDGNLAGRPVPSPLEGVMSATRFERWATCPFGYLMLHVLGVDAVHNPEEQLRISPLDKGSLVHDALARFVTESLGRPGTAGRPWIDTDRDRLAAIGAESCAGYEARGLTGRPIFWRRDRALILADLDRFLDADRAHQRLHGTRPLAAELAFGFASSALAPVAMALGDGRVVRFRGTADRLDEAGDGTLHVVDYKTGGAHGYEKLSQDDPDLRGTKLQLAVYGVASRAFAGRHHAAVRAEYWFVSAKGGFKRIGYDVTDEVLARVGSTLRAMVEGVESGVFPPRPDTLSTSPWVDCPACDPDALGVTELRRQWERKRSDPALAGYAALAEPLADVVVDVAPEEGPDHG